MRRITPETANTRAHTHTEREKERIHTNLADATYHARNSAAGNLVWLNEDLGTQVCKSICMHTYIYMYAYIYLYVCIQMYLRV